MTKYSWKGSTPNSAVSTMVRTMSFVIGKMRVSIFKRCDNTWVTSVKLAPSRIISVRNRCVATSRSPTRNQGCTPYFANIPKFSNVSPDTPQPVSTLASPAKVYITVSKSGEIRNPYN
ncbi:MAG: hypothetical protein KIH69_012415 [Anaerolineae bacterium]|nr:hypothetical protein [Anaerolineae bacterium]